jgi:hypothetical protein
VIASIVFIAATVFVALAATVAARLASEVSVWFADWLTPGKLQASATVISIPSASVKAKDRWNVRGIASLPFGEE